MTRLFGSREIVLGAATLLARGKTRRNLILAGIAVDAADAAAAVARRRGRGAVDRRTTYALAAPAAAAVLAEDGRPPTGTLDAGQPQSDRLTRAATPTTTITTRSTSGGSRRPTVAPIWPPITEPERDQAADHPVDVGHGDEEQGGDPVDEQRPARSWSRCAAAGRRRPRCRGSPSAARPGRRRSSRRRHRCSRTAGHTHQAPVVRQAAARRRPARRPARRCRGSSTTSRQAEPDQDRDDRVEGGRRQHQQQHGADRCRRAARPTPAAATGSAARPARAGSRTPPTC